MMNILKYSYYSVVNSYKNIFKDKDNNYRSNKSEDMLTNLYMVMRCMQSRLNSVDIEDILKKIGFNV